MSLYLSTSPRRRRRTTTPYTHVVPAPVATDAQERTVISGPALAADVTQQFSLTTGDLADLWAAEQAIRQGGV